MALKHTILAYVIPNMREHVVFAHLESSEAFHDATVVSFYSSLAPSYYQLLPCFTSIARPTFLPALC